MNVSPIRPKAYHMAQFHRCDSGNSSAPGVVGRGQDNRGEPPMSDYIPKDPLGPNSGGPTNDRYGYERYGNTRFEPADDAGKGPYILLGLLVAIGLIGGLLYFNG